MSHRRVALAGFALVVLYTVWIAWPYLRSVVVRDAAVTSWISISSAPIAGLTTRPLYAGSRVGADGRIATIADDRADRRELAKARAELIHAAANATAQRELVDGIRVAIEAREKNASGFAASYGEDLGAAITGAQATLVSQQQRLKLAQAEVDRVAKLSETGLMSQSALDKARMQVAELEHQIAQTTATLARSGKRRRASGAGVFLLEDGSNGNAAFHNLADARLRLVQAEAQLKQYDAEREAAEALVAATQQAYDKARSFDVLAPADALVWSLLASPGEALQAGAPIASWVDCRILLVDTPLSDVETSLLHVGSAADVVIEGERATRHGSVILTRGSAGTLGEHDLAAVAKGRHPGVGQALVRLSASPADIRACPIGHAAYVDFPEVGLFDVIRGRLRL